jgi:uncharacterized protein YbcV (DUF1398 family)
MYRYHCYNHFHIHLALIIPIYQCEPFTTAMNSNIQSSIRSILAAVHSPAGLPFPQTVAQLSALGVARYRVDYVSRTITTYTSTSSSSAPQHSTTTFPVEHSYTFGGWDKEGISKAIRKAQAAEGNYIDFSEGIVKNGVTDYTAYFEGKKVVYCGALGEVHVEWFPGAKPSDN